MKRCPECDFLYLDSDQFCDLDGSLLVTAEGSIETLVNERDSYPRRQSWKTAILAIGGVAFGVILFLVYHRMTRPALPTIASASPSLPANQSSPFVQPSPVASASATPQRSPSPSPKPSPTGRASPGSAGLSANPVSTSSDSKAKRGVIIKLTDGATIAADEAWRTKDGIWYRRNGIVALLKRNQVKAIEKAP